MVPLHDIDLFKDGSWEFPRHVGVLSLKTPEKLLRTQICDVHTYSGFGANLARGVTRQNHLFVHTRADSGSFQKTDFLFIRCGSLVAARPVHGRKTEYIGFWERVMGLGS
jgi:hypothetical protein